jgi:hypothetical protein
MTHTDLSTISTDILASELSKREKEERNRKHTEQLADISRENTKGQIKQIHMFYAYPKVNGVTDYQKLVKMYYISTDIEKRKCPNDR